MQFAYVGLTRDFFFCLLLKCNLFIGASWSCGLPWVGQHFSIGQCTFARSMHFCEQVNALWQGQCTFATQVKDFALVVSVCPPLSFYLF